MEASPFSTHSNQHRPKRFRLSEGDIFTIPLNENEVGFGQIVSFGVIKSVFIMIVFDHKEPQKTTGVYDIDSLTKSEILFLGYSNDARLYHHIWNIVGNFTNNISSVIFPYYRLGAPFTEMQLVDYKGRKISVITENIYNQLSYETEIAPIRYENALKAHFGLQEWKAEDYDKLLYENSIKSNEIAKRA